MTSEKTNLSVWAIAVAVVALILAGFATFSGGSQLGGSVIETVQTDFQNGLKVAGDLVFDGTSGDPVVTLGTSGTSVSSIIEGTANAATTLLPLEATSTDSFTLSVTGVTSSHECFVRIPNYDLVFGGLSVAGVTASTDTITFGILNNTGAATSSFRLATTSVAYLCVK